ncbi:MAG: GDSL-type esterase/lipase family protein [Propionibacteriales bacterium]|nr:GDSL-type esterase/lipase family protein [Propionibacteriales bacterium]
MRLRQPSLGILAVLLTSLAGLLATPSGVAALSTACAGQSDKHWVASWTAVPTDGLASVPPLHQTFRIQVVPHGDGSVARLRFSNRFGLAPVTLGAVTLGRQDTGATVAAGTLRNVTFRGARSVTIPRGADVVSDPVAMEVRAFRTLLASVYVAGVPGPATQHVLAGQTTWQTAPLSGDASGNPAAAGFNALPVPQLPAIPQGVPYLSGLDLRVGTATGTVVAFGDSITDGFQGAVAPVLPVPTNIDLDARYPDHLARRVRAAGLPLSVVNAGISGNQLLQDALVPIFGPSGLSRLERDGLDQPGTTTLILLEGINDIGQSLATPAALITGYRTAISRAHARGIRILLGTLTPDEGTLQPGYGATGESTRVAVNAWIRSQRLSDGVVDFDAAVRDPARPTRILPAYDGGDHLHFSPAGYAALAAAVPLGRLGLPHC